MAARAHVRCKLRTITRRGSRETGADRHKKSGSQACELASIACGVAPHACLLPSPRSEANLGADADTAGHLALTVRQPASFHTRSDSYFLRLPEPVTQLMPDGWSAPPNCL